MSLFRLRVSPSGPEVGPSNDGDVPGGLPPGGFGVMPGLHKSITCTPDALYTNTNSTTMVLIASAVALSTTPLLDFGTIAAEQYPDAVAAGAQISLALQFNMQARLATGALPVVRLEVDLGTGSFVTVAGATHSDTPGTGQTKQYALAGRVLMPTTTPLLPVRARATWMSGSSTVAILTTFNSDPAALDGGGGWHFDGKVLPYFA
jgi:hypothetical protein